jgi:hypothetical protein
MWKDRLSVGYQFRRRQLLVSWLVAVHQEMQGPGLCICM